MAIFLLLIFEIILGAVHILAAIWKYLKKEKPAAYYRDLEKYGAMVVGYFGIWWVASMLPVDWMSNDWGILWIIPFFFIVPFLIGAYFWYISNKEYYEGIEKLIF